jgi:hypothetical protein
MYALEMGSGGRFHYDRCMHLSNIMVTTASI